LSPLSFLLTNAVNLAIIITALIAILLIVAFLSAFKDGRKTLRKFWQLTLNLIGIDIGIGGFARSLILSFLTAITVAFAKGFGEHGFDWHLSSQ
jgi:hypothetical protein